MLTESLELDVKKATHENIHERDLSPLKGDEAQLEVTSERRVAIPKLEFSKSDAPSEKLALKMKHFLKAYAGAIFQLLHPGQRLTILQKPAVVATKQAKTVSPTS